MTGWKWILSQRKNKLADAEIRQIYTPGLEALKHYRRDYNQRLNEFKATPVHDWSSHGADAFGLMCVAYEEPREKRKASAGFHGAGGWMGG